MRGAPLLIALAAPLVGCVSLLPKAPPAPTIYTLAAAAPSQAVAANAKPVVIEVESPTMPRTLGGSDIAWIKGDRFAYIDQAAWDGRAADLLQSLLVLTIDRSGEVHGAVRAGLAHSDSEIGWDVTNFAVVENGALAARFAAHVNLFSSRRRSLISSLEVDESVPLADRTARAGTAALEEAARRGAEKIAAWAAQQTPLPEPTTKTRS